MKRALPVLLLLCSCSSQLQRLDDQPTSQATSDALYSDSFENILCRSVENAAFVVEATPLGLKRSATSTTMGTLWSEVVFRVDGALKGDAPDELVLLLKGGKLDDAWEAFAPRFDETSSVILVVRETDLAERLGLPGDYSTLTARTFVLDADGTTGISFDGRIPDVEARVLEALSKAGSCPQRVVPTEPDPASSGAGDAGSARPLDGGL